VPGESSCCASPRACQLLPPILPLRSQDQSPVGAITESASGRWLISAATLMGTTRSQRQQTPVAGPGSRARQRAPTRMGTMRGQEGKPATIGIGCLCPALRAPVRRASALVEEIGCYSGACPDHAIGGRPLILGRPIRGIGSTLLPKPRASARILSYSRALTRTHASVEVDRRDVAVSQRSLTRPMARALSRDHGRQMPC
jgi:hypothetical protein